MTRIRVMRLVWRKGIGANRLPGPATLRRSFVPKCAPAWPGLVRSWCRAIRRTVTTVLPAPARSSSDSRCNMTAATKVLTAHVPLPLADKVDQMASRLERSRGWIMKQALSAWIAQEEERERLTQEALADVDAGRVIDHQAVQAWAESLGTDQPLPVPR